MTTATPTMFAAPAPFGNLCGTLHSPRDGATEPVVVLWPSIFSTAAVQSDLIAILSRTRNVLAIDPPGHGASRVAIPTALTMVACAEATFALLDQANLGTVVWVGTSWGGLVGVEAALSHPGRLAHLACLNTPFAWDGPGWGKARWLPLMARTIATNRLFANGVAGDFFLPETRADPARAAAMATHDSGLRSGDRRQLAAAANLIFRKRADARPSLPKIDVPTLVIAGTKDRLYPQALQCTSAGMIPGAHFKLVESAHIAAVDCPAIVANLLEEAWTALSSR